MDVLFRTERLDVRHLTESDVDALLAVYGDRDAMRYVGDGEPLRPEDCERWVEVTRTNVEKRGYGMSALVDRETGEVIGFCGLVRPNDQPEDEIKYALRRDTWGSGLATEAVAGMLEHAATVLHLSRVIATVHPENAPSLRVLEKVGMRRGAPRKNPDRSTTLVLRWDTPVS